MSTSTSPQTTLPGIRRRLASMLYESLLLIGVLAALFVLPNFILVAATGIILPPRAIRAYVFLALAAYFLWHWRGGGQTLAMRTWKLQIASQTGAVPSLLRLAIRYVLAWPSVALGFGILWALVDRDRQFLHDRLAGTRIVFKN